MKKKLLTESYTVDYWKQPEQSLCLYIDGKLVYKIKKNNKFVHWSIVAEAKKGGSK